MDLPPELPCYNCGTMVRRSEKREMPSIGLPDLPPRYFGGAGADGAMRAISELGRAPDGVHLNESSYNQDLKRHIMKNWWCDKCYQERMKALES